MQGYAWPSYDKQSFTREGVQDDTGRKRIGSLLSYLLRVLSLDDLFPISLSVLLLRGQSLSSVSINVTKRCFAVISTQVVHRLTFRSVHVNTSTRNATLRQSPSLVLDLPVTCCATWDSGEDSDETRTSAAGDKGQGQGAGEGRQQQHAAVSMTAVRAMPGVTPRGGRGLVTSTTAKQREEGTGGKGRAIQREEWKAVREVR